VAIRGTRWCAVCHNPTTEWNPVLAISHRYYPCWRCCIFLMLDCKTCVKPIRSGLFRYNGHSWHTISWHYPFLIWLAVHYVRVILSGVKSVVDYELFFFTWNKLRCLNKQKNINVIILRTPSKMFVTNWTLGCSFGSWPFLPGPIFLIVWIQTLT
jgi:hypothetical protein